MSLLAWLRSAERSRAKGLGYQSINRNRPPAELAAPTWKVPPAQDASGYRIPGPTSYETLSVFLIHGPGHAGRKLIALQVIVYETQSVNELAIANMSTEEDVSISLIQS